MAVRIPAELAYSSWDIELVIERQGDELRIRPARRRMGDVLGKLAQFSPDFMSKGRGRNAEGEREAHNRAVLDSLLEDIVVAPFEARAARAYGPLRAANRSRSKDVRDKLIASHALSLGVTLVTNHEADFRAYTGLGIENWINSH